MRGRERDVKRKEDSEGQVKKQRQTKTEAEAERMHSVVIVERQEIKKMSYSLIYSLILHREFLSWGSLLLDYSILLQVDIKLFDKYRNTFHHTA